MNEITIELTRPEAKFLIDVIRMAQDEGLTTPVVDSAMNNIIERIKEEIIKQ